jgi:hypothetical protein
VIASPKDTTHTCDISPWLGIAIADTNPAASKSLTLLKLISTYNLCKYIIDPGYYRLVTILNYRSLQLTSVQSRERPDKGVDKIGK